MLSCSDEDGREEAVLVWANDGHTTRRKVCRVRGYRSERSAANATAWRWLDELPRVIDATEPEQGVQQAIWLGKAGMDIVLCAFADMGNR